MRDEANGSESIIGEEESGNGHRLPVHRRFSPKPFTIGVTPIAACTCGSCEVCQLRAFMLAHGEKLGWQQLSYSACSAVAAGENYWQLFAVTHDMSVLARVRTAILEAEQEALVPAEAASTTSVSEPRKVPPVQATDLWGEGV